MSDPQQPVNSVRLVPFDDQHLAQMIPIEKSGFRRPWTEEDFLQFVSERDHSILVCTHGRQIVGYCCYSRGINLNSMSVHSEWRRKRIGTFIVDQLKVLAEVCGNSIKADVSEYNLDAQLFLQSQGFNCVQFFKDPYGIKNHDGYRMLWQKQKVASR